jgi:hypothetical protein
MGGDSIVKLRRRRKSYGFTKFPNMWREQLHKTGACGSTFVLAMVILDKSRWAEWITLPNKGLAKMGINRYTKYRGVKQLLAAGLILTKQGPGKSIRIKAMFRE